MNREVMNETTCTVRKLLLALDYVLRNLASIGKEIAERDAKAEKELEVCPTCQGCRADSLVGTGHRL